MSYADRESIRLQRALETVVEEIDRLKGRCPEAEQNLADARDGMGRRYAISERREREAAMRKPVYPLWCSDRRAEFELRPICDAKEDGSLVRVWCPDADPDRSGVWLDARYDRASGGWLSVVHYVVDGSYFERDGIIVEPTMFIPATPRLESTP